MIHRITSRSNPRVKDLVKRRAEYFIFEGEKLVHDILARNLEVEILILDQGKEGRLPLEGQNIRETWIVHETVLSKITSLKESPGFAAVLKMTDRKIDFKNSRAVIALDNIQDPGNTGTIFRCAAAFGIDALALCGACVAPNNPKFLRAAQGTVLDVPYQRFPGREQLLELASREKYNIFATAANPGERATALDEVPFPCLILLGSEGQGLPTELISRYPCLYISQEKMVESLNAGVSACIIMHELHKRL